MQRTIPLLSTVALLAAVAEAQCLNVSAPGTAITLATGDSDDGISGFLALGFNFPIAGAVNATYSHVRVGTNGWIFLSDGVSTAGLPGSSSYGSTTNASTGLRGAAGNHPLLAPYWGDLVSATMFIDSTSNPGVSTRISWVNSFDWNSNTTFKSFQAEIFATGEVRYSYSNGMQNTATASTTSRLVAVSSRNNIALPAASNLSPGPAATAGGMMFEQFAVGALDLADKTLSFMPAGAGWNESVVCQGAFHAAYGTGCYNITSTNEAFHEFFGGPVAASAALQGNAMVLTPGSNGYTASWVAGGASAYVAPTGGASNVFTTASDDANVAYTPSTPLPIPGGQATTLNIMSNGVISVGSVAANANDYSPTSAEFGATTIAAFYSWHDFNETETSSSPAYTSGRIKREEAGGVLYVTWDNVENYANPDNVQNPSTMQFQFNLSTGVVTCLWVTVDTNATESTFPLGLPYLVGYSGPGASTAPAPITLSSGLPLTTANNMFALSLSASPAPVYSIGNPTVPVTYTLNNMIDVGGGVGLPLLIFSVAPLPGVDLAFIGAPGCNLNIASFDVILNPSSTAPTSTLTLAIPQPLSPGLAFFSQGVSLFVPNSLPNGENALGATFSNGLQTNFNTF